ncbi:hypothetical protein E3N88_43403 [Mikania micrantha]|uniref:Protein kinase domain-containing protein n=1 Tax=Mikania micrantha TaxID=192012 RepID=A0A5N6LH92_9ASTR|nr:hypothetical protein E3N88_43403 [Mikania micrantha]
MKKKKSAMALVPSFSSLSPSIYLHHLPSQVKEMRDRNRHRRYTQEMRNVAIMSCLGVFDKDLVMMVSINDTAASTVWNDNQLMMIVFITINEGRLDENLLFDYLIIVVSSQSNALQFLHNIGIVHRDVKPVNALLEKSIRLHLADLGSDIQFETIDRSYMQRY